jgi:hypothetical protein
VLVDLCDLHSGLVQQVVARGAGRLLPFDAERGRRKLQRYLGPDETRWNARFLRYVYTDPDQIGTMWLRLIPRSLRATDLSYKAAQEPH